MNISNNSYNVNIVSHILSGTYLKHILYLAEIITHLCYIWITTFNVALLPNQELSGAKSELPGETVGVCSSHKRCGQLPYNLPITHLQFTPRSLQVCLLAHFNK